MSVEPVTLESFEEHVAWMHAAGCALSSGLCEEAANERADGVIYGCRRRSPSRLADQPRGTWEAKAREAMAVAVEHSKNLSFVRAALESIPGVETTEDDADLAGIIDRLGERLGTTEANAAPVTGLHYTLADSDGQMRLCECLGQDDAGRYLFESEGGDVSFKVRPPPAPKWSGPVLSSTATSSPTTPEPEPRYSEALRAIAYDSSWSTDRWVTPGGFTKRDAIAGMLRAYFDDLEAGSVGE